MTKLKSSRAFQALVATTLATSLGIFIFALIASGLDGIRKSDLTDWAAAAAIVAIWIPAFAAIPAAILGFLIERPKAKWLIARREGGLVISVLASVAAGALLSLLLRIVLYLFDGKTWLYDPFSLSLFAWLGFCSGVSWWIFLVEPGRRA